MTDQERRKEQRVRSRGQVTLSAETGDNVAGTIYDVSVSGLSVEAARGIPIGTAVEVESLGFAASGEVSYCERRGAVFRIGVQLG